MLDDDTFRGWAGTICEGLLAVPTTFAAVLAWDDDDEIVLAGLAIEDVTDLSRLQAMINEQPRRVLGMATQVSWAHEDDEPTTPAWLVAVVSPDREAGFYVKRHVEDERWWSMTPTQVPWIALSTAGSLRRVLAGEPFPTFKSTHDPRLLSRPDQTPNPPIGPDGRL